MLSVGLLEGVDYDADFRLEHDVVNDGHQQSLQPELLHDHVDESQNLPILLDSGEF